MQVQSLGEGNSNPLQYSCLGNSMDRRAWWATVRGVARLRDQTTSTKDKLFGSERIPSTNVDELKYKSMVKYRSRKSYGMLDFTGAQFP